MSFANHYYSTLATDKKGLASLYLDISCLFYNDWIYLGTDKIIKILEVLPELHFDTDTSKVDVQPSYNDSIFVRVNSTCSFEDGSSKKFTQTFYLVKGGPDWYFINNSTLCLYQD